MYTGNEAAEGWSLGTGEGVVDGCDVLVEEARRPGVEEDVVRRMSIPG